MKLSRKRKKKLKKNIKFYINGKLLKSHYIRIIGVGKYRLINPKNDKV